MFHKKSQTLPKHDTPCPGFLHANFPRLPSGDNPIFPSCSSPKLLHELENLLSRKEGMSERYIRTRARAEGLEFHSDQFARRDRVHRIARDGKARKQAVPGQDVGFRCDSGVYSGVHAGARRKWLGGIFSYAGSRIRAGGVACADRLTCVPMGVVRFFSEGTGWFRMGTPIKSG